MQFSFKSKFAFIAAIIIFRLLLDCTYVYFVNIVYGIDSVLSFELEFNTVQYLISWVLFLFSLIFVRHRLKKFSDYFFLTAVLELIAPLTSVFGLNSEKPIFPVIATILAIATIYLFVKLNDSTKVSIPYFKGSREKIIALSWTMLFAMICWFIATGVLGNLNFDLNQVYDFRDTNSEAIDIGIFAYANIWTYKFFNIFLLCYALLRKNFTIVLGLLAVQVVFFGVNAHKLTLFLPLLAIGAWLYFKRTDLLILLPLGYFFIVFVSFLSYIIYDYELLSAMMIRRAFFVPAGLTFEWFDFFANNPQVYWSDRLLSVFIDYPYALNIPNTIGEFLFSRELYANNGFVSSGYAHAGLLGIILYAILFGFLIRIFNQLGDDGVPIWFSLAITIGPIRTALLDSDLLTTIASHGLLIALIILIMFRERDANS